LFRQLFKFFSKVKSNSIIGIQYPLLSINKVFKYFIKIANIKKIYFFCIVHDLESLRTGGKDLNLIKAEIDNLHYFDAIIVHNDQMVEWLKNNGLERPMISLILFDYLSVDFLVGESNLSAPVVYAGNLGKSKFIYQLPAIKPTCFNLYGPNFFLKDQDIVTNLNWNGEYSPDEIPKHLKGSFGLIWDGDNIEKCDDILGNYLRYNNPHKFSLYLAAGLPVIAPADSAIANFIKTHKIGLLINNIKDLIWVDCSDIEYQDMKKNVLEIRQKVINGSFFSEALNLVEKKYAEV